MKTERPTSVLVMGILNIIFGSLGLGCGICGGVGIFALFGAFGSVMDKVPPADRAPLQAVLTTLEQFKALMIGQIVLQIILSVVLLAAGIGLLSMKSWARWASVAYSVATIFLAIGGLVISLAWVNPAVEKMQKDMLARHGQAAAPAQPISQNLSSVLGALVSMAYAVVLLIMMLLPNVSAAFAGRPFSTRMPDPDWEHDPDRRF